MAVTRKTYLPILLVALLSGIFSCNVIKKNNDSDKKRIARAFDAYLYITDIDGIVPKGSKPADSIKIVNDYITRWMQQQVIVHQATNNLDPKQVDFSRQIEDYKNSLIIYEYEKELVKEKLDTTISENEINDYYDKNKKDFQLKNDIVKIIYVKVGKKVAGQDKFEGMDVFNQFEGQGKACRFLHAKRFQLFFE